MRERYTPKGGTVLVPPFPLPPDPGSVLTKLLQYGIIMTNDLMRCPCIMN